MKGRRDSLYTFSSDHWHPFIEDKEDIFFLSFQKHVIHINWEYGGGKKFYDCCKNWDSKLEDVGISRYRGKIRGIDE